MARIKKYASNQDLDKIHVFVEDTDEFSKYFSISELPQSFTGGKNGFLITGTDFLELGTSVKIEVVDSDGDAVYVEPGKGIPEYYESNAKVVAVYVYEDTPFGDGEIRIVGELREYEDADGVRRTVPEDWAGVYNVRWKKRVKINPRASNETTIRFYKRPVLTITEIVRNLYERSATTVTLNSGSVSGKAGNPVAGTNFRFFNGETEYQLTLTGSGADFQSSMIGKTMTVTGLAESYTPEIQDILSNKRALATIPYIVTSSLSQVVTNFETASYSITHELTSSLSSTQASASFAQIDVTRMNTFTGDINRIKLYRKSLNKASDYELIQDQQLESKELLIDTSSATLDKRTGYFVNSDIIDSYWTSSLLDTSFANVNMQYSTNVLLDAMFLEGDSDTSTPETARYSIYNTTPFTLESGVEYTLSFKLYGTKGADATTPSLFEVYISGSAVDNEDTYGDLLLSKQYQETIRREYRTVEANFIASSDGNGYINFVQYFGDWYISDVSLRASYETAFSPDEASFIIPMPTDLADETFVFKAEFFDINSNRVPILVESDNIVFTGGNRLILDSNNQPIETGKGLLYIGDYGSLTGSRILNNNSLARDAVSTGSETGYFAWKGADGTTVASAGQPPAAGNANWEKFTQFASVATGLLIAEESFVKNTINIGINSSGSSANITLHGSGSEPYISLGQPTQGYGELGAYIGISGSEAVFSLSGSSNHILWTTGSLDIQTDVLKVDAVNFDIDSEEQTLVLGEGNLIISGTTDDTGAKILVGAGKQTRILSGDFTDISDLSLTNTFGNYNDGYTGSAPNDSVYYFGDSSFEGTSPLPYSQMENDLINITPLPLKAIFELELTASTDAGIAVCSMSLWASSSTGEYLVSQSEEFNIQSGSDGTIQRIEFFNIPHTSSEERFYFKLDADFPAIGSLKAGWVDASVDWITQDGVSQLGPTGLQIAYTNNDYIVMSQGDKPYTPFNDTTKLIELRTTQDYAMFIIGNFYVLGTPYTTNSGGWEIVSDRKIKSNIKSLTPQSSLGVINTLNPISYKIKNEYSDELDTTKSINYGFIAQEYKKHFPESGKKVKVKGEDTHTISTGELIPYLVSAVQALSAKIEALESGSV